MKKFLSSCRSCFVPVCTLASVVLMAACSSDAGTPALIDNPVFSCEAEYTVAGNFVANPTRQPGDVCIGTGVWTITTTQVEGDCDNAPSAGNYEFTATIPSDWQPDPETPEALPRDLDVVESVAGRRWTLRIDRDGAECSGIFQRSAPARVVIISASEDSSGGLFGVGNFFVPVGD